MCYGTGKSRCGTYSVVEEASSLGGRRVTSSVASNSAVLYGPDCVDGREDNSYGLYGENNGFYSYFNGAKLLFDKYNIVHCVVLLATLALCPLERMQ